MAYKLCLTNYEIRKDKSDELWIIHGLWPTMFQKGAKPMLGCQRYDITFSQSQFVGNKIFGVLDTIWYTLLFKKLQDNKKFWEHEFSKHGSCATCSTVIEDGVDYFKRSLELYVDVIEKKVGAKVKIDFVQNPHTGDNYITELYICYDTHLRVMDCPNVYWSNERLETDIRYLNQLPRA